METTWLDLILLVSTWTQSISLLVGNDGKHNKPHSVDRRVNSFSQVWIERGKVLERGHIIFHLLSTWWTYILRSRGWTRGNGPPRYQHENRTPTIESPSQHYTSTQYYGTGEWVSAIGRVIANRPQPSSCSQPVITSIIYRRSPIRRWSRNHITIHSTSNLYLYRYRIMEMFLPRIDGWCVTYVNSHLRIIRNTHRAIQGGPFREGLDLQGKARASLIAGRA